MKWRIVISSHAQKQLSKVGRSVEIEISHYLKTRLATAEDPCRFGKPLSGKLSGLWRYRVRDYRVICEIQNHELIILVVRVGHRREIYH
ncbi:MAG: type II toxin-antitoxin system RelE/ParE family toxin [Chthoniobacterales bacterium]|nr:type II toxin-antitoxin system RelE/ParE family toxin [Chthoniobacterales bacterium]